MHPGQPRLPRTHSASSARPPTALLHARRSKARAANENLSCFGFFVPGGFPEARFKNRKSIVRRRIDGLIAATHYSHTQALSTGIIRLIFCANGVRRPASQGISRPSSSRRSGSGYVRSRRGVWTFRYIVVTCFLYRGSMPGCSKRRSDL